MDPRPMPRIDNIFINITKATLMSKLDWKLSYWHVLLNKDASCIRNPISTFMFHYAIRNDEGTGHFH